ncbi:hypothetical protein GCM10017044_14530 [Kordiimonas sediminis]|uniref:MetA-pathway of phenol degradation n=1 Tax=Kordiimonas sediminis TaxID=1735581 RepID=A0A919AS27_9PROT|nr:transporter [Kordiimonas sediminis]GHF20717.1 hypothetical protein GCM10017044_14530 [Kordiimonas sediminis]
MFSKSFRVATAAASVLMSTTALMAHDGYQARVDDHAPIGVMADHYHKAGEWMASARYMTMQMDDPTSAIGPQEMSKSMIMAGVMYAPVDWVTFAASLGFSDQEMTSNMMPMGDMGMTPMPMEMNASGITDLNVNALFPVFDTGSSRLVAKAGLSLPTGDDNDLSDAGMRLGQNMQSGTGSYGFKPALTYSNFQDGWSFGGQLSAVIWLDDNSYNQRSGDSWMTTAWVSKTLSPSFSISARTSYDEMEDAKGKLHDYGTRKRWMAYGGVNYVIRDGSLAGNRFAVEVGAPLDENRADNNLGTDYRLIVGWQLAF